MTLRHEVEQHRQNKPSRLAREMSAYMPYDLAMEMLLRHGVFKWFAARRDLLRLKDSWRLELHAARGVRCNTLVHCREAIRKICKSPRLRAPDHDAEAQRWLERRTRCA